MSRAPDLSPAAEAWYTAAELAGLPGMPGAEKHVRKKAQRESWPFRPRQGRGGGREYAFDALPAAAQAALMKRGPKPGGYGHPALSPHTGHPVHSGYGHPALSPHTGHPVHKCEQPGATPSSLTSTPRVLNRRALSESPNARRSFYDSALPPASMRAYDKAALWAFASGRSQRQREAGRRKADLLRQVMRLHELGEPLGLAFNGVSQNTGVRVGTLRNWYYGANGKPGAKDYDREDWLAALIPGHAGRCALAAIPPAAFDWYCGYYLTRRRPSAAEAYRRVSEVARAERWGPLPAADTFWRRLKREVSGPVIVLLREGEQALMRRYPPQRRDKRAFAAGEAVVGDGLKFDRLWVAFPDGEILNTATGWFWADLRTNYIAAFRLGKTENTDLFRLATYDLTGHFKPRLAWLDNTMAAANKAMTGRAAGRRRFTDQPADPMGLLRQMDITPLFTHPDKIMGNPGAKPIERSFGVGGLHDKVASHPDFIKRGYSKATAIPYEEFAAVVAEEVRRFNEQPNRQTPVCRGVLSFRAAFHESIKDTPLTCLSEAQRALLLLMPETVRVHGQRGEIALRAGRSPMGRHRYYADALNAWQGQQVVAWYDPEALTRPVTVQTLAGRTLCRAEHQGDVAFHDMRAAREHSKNKQRWLKAQKRAAAAEVRMTELEVRAQYPGAGLAPPRASGRPARGGEVVGGNFKQKLKVDVETGEILSEPPRASGRPARGGESEPPASMQAYEGGFIDLTEAMRAEIKRRADGLI